MKIMKHIIQKVQLITIITIIFLLLGTGFVSSAEQAVLKITAVVDKSLEITVIPNNENDLLDLRIQQDDVKVGEVEERANVQNGYQVILVSENAKQRGQGKPYLVGESNDNDMSLEYEIYYEGEKVVFDNSGEAIVTDTVSLTTALGVNRDVSISYDGRFMDFVSDYYSDTLTFSIVPK